MISKYISSTQEKNYEKGSIHFNATWLATQFNFNITWSYDLYLSHIVDYLVNICIKVLKLLYSWKILRATNFEDLRFLLNFENSILEFFVKNQTQEC